MINHVVDRKTAKKLKDYLPEGWVDEWKIKFYWYKMPDGKYNVFLPREERILHIDAIQICPAPILSELLELLPAWLPKDVIEVGYVFRFYKSKRFEGTKHEEEFYCIGYRLAKDNSESLHDEMHTNPAAAAAKLYMWLVDEGHTGTKNKCEYCCNTPCTCEEIGYKEANDED